MLKTLRWHLRRALNSVLCFAAVDWRELFLGYGFCWGERQGFGRLKMNVKSCKSFGEGLEPLAVE